LSESSRAAKSVSIMIVFGLASNMLGFIREMLIASKFGSGEETDAFFIALAATSLFTAVITQSLNTTMIPILSEIENNEGIIGKKNHTNNLLNIIILISIIIVFLGLIFSPNIIKLLAYGFEGGQLDLAVTMFRIGMPVVIFSGVVGIYRGYLQSESMFIESSVSQLPFNFTYIFFLIFLSSMFGIRGLMVTSVLAVCSQIFIQIPGVRKTGYRYSLKVNFKDPYIKKIMFLVMPVLVSVAVNDLNKIIDKSLASTLLVGSISALNYSARLNRLVMVVFITAIATVLFPMLSKEAAKDSYDSFKILMRYGINIILIITIPTTIGILLLSEPIVKLIFERGAFDSTATYMTSQALIFYSLGLVGMALRTFMERAYYSLHDTKTPMMNGFITVGLNIVLNFILIGPMEYKGLALGTAIATTVTTGFLFYGLKRKIGPLGFTFISSCAMKSLSSAMVMGITILFIYNILIDRVSSSALIEGSILLITIGIGAIVYLTTLYLLKVDEIIWFINLFRKRFKI